MDNVGSSSSSPSKLMLDRLAFHPEQHVKYAKRCLTMLPTPYESEDCSRLSLAFFALSSLELLGKIDELDAQARAGYIDWIYAQQVKNGHAAGFRGGPHVGLSNSSAEPAHIAMTYTAILCLGILRDDFTRFDISGTINFVNACQAIDGSFAPFPGSDERDVRFVYCALVICTLCRAMDQIDVSAAIAYIMRCRVSEVVHHVYNAAYVRNACQNYDYAFGQKPLLESQGGTTYCAIASLALAGRLNQLEHRVRTVDWLAHRVTPLDLDDLDEEDFWDYDNNQSFLSELRDESVTGCQGRPGKSPDACYSFWVGASLQLLGQDDPACRPPRNDNELKFLCLCQMPRMGGIAKFPGEYPDVYHTYLALAAFSLHGQSSLKDLDPAVNVSRDVLARLHKTLDRHKLVPA